MTKATAPSTEGRCVMLSWQKMLLFSSTTPTQTLRRPKNYWSTLPGLNWKPWAHSAGRLLKLYCVTTSSKNVTLGWHLLLHPFAGKIYKINKWGNSVCLSANTESFQKRKLLGVRVKAKAGFCPKYKVINWTKFLPCESLVIPYYTRALS